MKILQLCKKVPYPFKDGEVIAIYHLSKAFYALGQEVDILAIRTPKHDVDKQQIPSTLAALERIETVFIDTKVRVLPALANLFTTQSYNIQRFYSNVFEERLIHYLRSTDYDIIHLEGVYLASYLPTIRKYAPQSKVVMRAHNIEFEIWERLTQTTTHPLKKWYFNLLAKRMQRFEQEHLNAYDAMVPISPKDAEGFRAMGCKIPIHTTLTGVDTEKLRMKRNAIEALSVFHLGSMDWLPNQEGVRWFLDNIWKYIVQKQPNAIFYLAGRNMPADFYKLDYPNVQVVGEVEDAVDFMNSKAVMIVPLLSGSGMRIKLMEALALGKTIVTTTVGCEGIGVEDGKHLKVADTVAEFRVALLWCLEHPSEADVMGVRGHDLVHERYENKALAASLIDFYKRLIN